jgi:hypothetical protein
MEYDDTIASAYEQYHNAPWLGLVNLQGIAEC